MQLQHRRKIIGKNTLDVGVTFQERIRLFIHQPGNMVFGKRVENDRCPEHIPETGDLADAGVNLRPAIATGELKTVASALRKVVSEKPRRHQLNADGSGEHEPFAMSNIGG